MTTVTLRSLSSAMTCAVARHQVPRRGPLASLKRSDAGLPRAARASGVPSAGSFTPRSSWCGIRKEDAGALVDDHRGIPADQRPEQLRPGTQRVLVLLLSQLFELARREGPFVDLLAHRRDRQPGPAFDSELQEQPRDVALHGLLADAQLVGDGLVR